MISLKKHIEAHSEELLNGAVTAYRATLSAIASACAQALPSAGVTLQQRLTVLRERVCASAMATVQQEVDQELAQWGENAALYSSNKTREIKEMMVAMATATEALAERDQRYSQEFAGLTTRLQSIARLEDLTSIRRSVVNSATELKAAVGKMAQEGELSISQLRAEVTHYRTMLEQVERREASDTLTGLASRREIEMQIDDRIVWRKTFCLALLDLNGFKKINDVFGHLAGDDALQQFASELRAQFRPIDVVGRWGGDEFVVIVDSIPEEAEARLERVRQWAFGDYTICNGKATVDVHLDASIGIASWDGQETAAQLLARADERMYAEKHLTRIMKSSAA